MSYELGVGVQLNFGYLTSQTLATSDASGEQTPQLLNSNS